MTRREAMHYQFNPLEKSADGGVEGTEVKIRIRNGGENV
jgi:hypothetical protein